MSVAGRESLLPPVRCCSSSPEGAVTVIHKSSSRGSAIIQTWGPVSKSCMLEIVVSIVLAAPEAVSKPSLEPVRTNKGPAPRAAKTSVQPQTIEILRQSVQVVFPKHGTPSRAGRDSSEVHTVATPHRSRLVKAVHHWAARQRLVEVT